MAEGDESDEVTEAVGPNEIADHARVRLLAPVEEDGEYFPVGTTGAVVGVYRGGEAFAVEVVEGRGEPAILTVPAAKLEVIR